MEREIAPVLPPPLPTTSTAHNKKKKNNNKNNNNDNNNNNTFHSSTCYDIVLLFKHTTTSLGSMRTYYLEWSSGFSHYSARKLNTYQFLSPFSDYLLPAVQSAKTTTTKTTHDDDYCKLTSKHANFNMLSGTVALASSELARQKSTYCCYPRLFLLLLEHLRCTTGGGLFGGGASASPFGGATSGALASIVSPKNPTKDLEGTFSNPQTSPSRVHGTLNP